MAKGRLRARGHPCSLYWCRIYPLHPPQQRRLGGRSLTVQSESFSRGLTMPSHHNAPPPEQPRPSKENTRRGEKSVTKPTEKSARAKSQSHHQANPDDYEDPLQGDVRAQNLLIQEQEELIQRLKQQLRERRALNPPPVRNHASGPPPRHGQAPPSHERDLRHVLNKRRNRVHDKEDSSNSHVPDGPKKQHQKLEDDKEFK